MKDSRLSARTAKSWRGSRPRNSTKQQPPSRAKENKMEEDKASLNLGESVPCERKIVRLPPQVVCELAYERREVSDNLAKLKKAIDANPDCVSEHHKELWRKQAKAMQEYVDVLGERIKDLIDNDKE